MYTLYTIITSSTYNCTNMYIIITYQHTCNDITITSSLIVDKLYSIYMYITTSVPTHLRRASVIGISVVYVEVKELPLEK